MFRNMSNERGLSGGQKPASLAGHGVSSAALDDQESSWIGLLSVVSRPALSLLHKYVTGSPRTPALSEREAGWVGVELKIGIDEEGDFLRHLDDMVPTRQLAVLRCRHDAAAGGLLEQRPGGPALWLSAESLHNAEERRFDPNGYLSSLRTFLSRVVWSSSQEIRPTAGREWGADVKPRTRWGIFSQSRLLSEVSWAEEVTGQLCPQKVAETKAAETTTVFVQSSNRESTLGENTGATDHRDQLANNEGLHTVQSTSGSTSNHRLAISEHLSGAGAACCEVLLLSPDHDNGYSSLEEEHVLMYVVTASAEQSLAGVKTQVEEENAEKRDSTSGGMEEEPIPIQEDQSGLELVPPTPQCQNKAIAYIMGCPCSDDDSSSQSDEESSGDDDGFDSEGSSDLSDITDEDDDKNSETEHLWRPLCHNRDPYNPQNFSASLHTGRTPPRTVPPSTPPSSSQSTPSSTPPGASDTWDDATSASEVDEAESLHLWSSFSCSSDPYSPFNFQAPLRTRGPSEAAWAKSKCTKASQPLLPSPHHEAASPPEYRKEEAEERLDSGFSEHSSGSSTSHVCASTKKVRFSDEVEEFFASCGEEEEDRRGPWEELARDRCRFLRRCQEVEQSIAYCLEPPHRSLVYQRLTVLQAQDA